MYLFISHWGDHMRSGNSNADRDCLIVWLFDWYLHHVGIILGSKCICLYLDPFGQSGMQISQMASGVTSVEDALDVHHLLDRLIFGSKALYTGSLDHKNSSNPNPQSHPDPSIKNPPTSLQIGVLDMDIRRRPWKSACWCPNLTEFTHSYIYISLVLFSFIVFYLFILIFLIF